MRKLLLSCRSVSQLSAICSSSATTQTSSHHRNLHQLHRYLNLQSHGQRISSAVLRYSPGLLQSHRSTVIMGECTVASSADEKPNNEMSLSDDACPQGVQGDDCVHFKLWMDNCRRYGLANCTDQLQGIQSGRKTLAEVMAEQDRLIAEIAEQYRMATRNHARKGDAQGVQDSFTAFPEIDSPCPQGVQGDDCARFKLWLENCHRFGLHDCMQQYESFKAGRKTLAQIFVEQDQLIRQAATAAYQQANLKQHRKYSTSAGRDPDKDATAASAQGEVTQLTQRQKLQRAVKEYGSTVIVFHVTISLISLGFFYLLVSSGIDIVGLLTKLGIGQSLLQNKLAAGTGTFVVAYAVHKVFAPVRIATTLTATPFIVRYLRQIGFLKVPKHSKGE